MFLTVDAEGATLSGINRSRMELLLTICIALAVVLSIKVVGIVLVSGLMIIPSTIGKMTADSFKQFEEYSVLASIVSVILGLLLSYYIDIPSGATIVLVGVSMLIVVSLFQLIRKK
jgi:zinc transport system permease protein